MASGTRNKSNMFVPKLLSNISINDVIIPGIYLCSGNLSDSPDGNGHLIVIGNGTKAMIKQIWIPYRTPGSNDNHIYTRGTVDGTTWGSWVKYEGVFVS